MVTESQISNVIKQNPHAVAPYEQFDMNKVLEREYLVANIDWDVGSTTGTVLNFPRVLFDNNFIAEKIEDFRYFTGGIELSVRVTSTKFQYGTIIVAYSPYNPGIESFDDAIAGNHNSILTGFPHVIMNAQAGDASIVKIPFINPARYLDLTNYLNDEIAKVIIKPLNPLRTIDGVDSSASILVTAKFIDAKLLMPHATFFVGQSSVIKEAITKSQSTISSVNNATKPLQSGIHTMVSHPLTSTVMAGAALALNKPLTLDSKQINKINPFADVNYGTGIDLGSTISFDPQNNISTDPIVGGFEYDEMALTTLVGTPKRINVVTLAASSLPQVISQLNSNEFSSSYVDLVSSQFRYASGTLKFKMYINASAFHSIKLIFWLSDEQVVSADNYVNCYHKVVDVQGFTETEIAIPYLSPNVIDSHGAMNRDFTLYVVPIQWATLNPLIDNAIDINIYKAGASDFRFGGLRERRYTFQSNPRADFQKEFPYLQESMKEYLQDRLVLGDEYKSVREILHRYQPESLYSSSTDIPPWQSNGGSVYGYKFWGSLYAFWRGSLRFKLVSKDTETIKMAYFQPSDDNEFMGIALSTSVNPTMDISLPYYDTQLFRNTKDVYTNTSLRFSGGPNPQSQASYAYLLRAMGDDFSMHFIVPPKPGTFTGVPVTAGILGFGDYLSSYLPPE